MPILLNIQNLQKAYGSQVLLDHASVAFNDLDKVGMIGRNGAGKSTFCRIVLGDEEADAGEIHRHPQLRIGYLRQHDPFLPGESVLDFLMRDSGQPDWRCGQVAGEFELKGRYLEGEVKGLSGGWQTRVKLAALLLHEPNFLILDEPTNFLDLRTQLLLEDFLKNFRGGALIVSHDRTFLNATCTHTLDHDRGRLTLYPGTVDAYIAFRAEQREHDERVNATVASKRKQLEIFINKNRANANTASQARNKAKQLERLQIKKLEGAAATVRMRVPVVEARKGTALRCENLSIGYPDLTIATGVNVEIEYGSRVAVVGDNGQGKTTFLRTIVNSLSTKGGTFKWGYGCEIGCYAQHVYTTLPPDKTVYEYLTERAASDVTGQTVLDVAGSFLFRGDEVNKSISVLSGGERARLCMAGILLGRYTVLILDEPGNHLDVETVEALADALISYRGTIVFTTHDRHFMSRIATNIVEVRDGNVVNYLGNYETYLYRVKKEIEDGARSTAAQSTARQESRHREETKEEKKARARREYDLKCELRSIDRQMEKYTTLKRELDEQIVRETEQDNHKKLVKEHIKVCDKLAEIEERWLKVQEELGLVAD